MVCVIGLCVPQSKLRPKCGSKRFAVNSHHVGIKRLSESRHHVDIKRWTEARHFAKSKSFHDGMFLQDNLAVPAGTSERRWSPEEV
ncbi:hypothetical protein PHYSODRAFT_333704 [Phytophthora sojae]|uniref:Uncharacterized protein n=1 Tax=Phytophthora sojae (strain P6497) TaxID=1094619 RepID=G4ZPC5_PHYSP|nr:hypothetical protein PHYSODRAFT_333704 [Phytophthora sojae]EGZ15459.1 hypothetical protein PHYSODRAFT_333704 [Phytophthora sojae]|eukprot:XP_009529208.1 hypothetical protein PHYSODRAFT_333704 [Phytophthora sojae]